MSDDRTLFSVVLTETKPDELVRLALVAMADVLPEKWDDVEAVTKTVLELRTR